MIILMTEGQDGGGPTVGRGGVSVLPPWDPLCVDTGLPWIGSGLDKALGHFCQDLSPPRVAFPRDYWSISGHKPQTGSHGLHGHVGS